MRLDSKEEEKNWAGKDVQQVRDDRNGNALTSEENVFQRWKKLSKELTDEENDRKRRTDGGNLLTQEELQ